MVIYVYPISYGERFHHMKSNKQRGCDSFVTTKIPQKGIKYYGRMHRRVCYGKQYSRITRKNGYKPTKMR